MLKFALVLATLIGLSALPVSGFCPLPSIFGSNYYTGSNETPADALGAFWGFGNFSLSGGHDNGTYPARDWVRVTPGLGVYVAGDWAGDARIDGCIQDPPNPQPARMAFAFSQPGAIPGTTAFVAACSEEDESQSFYFTESANQSEMGLVPRPIVLSSVRLPGGGIQVLVAPPVFDRGIFDEADCGFGIIGYRLYSIRTPLNGPAPSDRRISAGWVLEGGTNAPATPALATLNCGGPYDSYMAFSPVFSDGVELQHVGQNSTVLQCRILADAPGTLRRVDKPLRHVEE